MLYSTFTPMLQAVMMFPYKGVYVNMFAISPSSAANICHETQELCLGSGILKEFYSCFSKGTHYNLLYINMGKGMHV